MYCPFFPATLFGVMRRTLAIPGVAGLHQPALEAPLILIVFRSMLCSLHVLSLDLPLTFPQATGTRSAMYSRALMNCRWALMRASRKEASSLLRATQRPAAEGARGGMAERAAGGCECVQAAAACLPKDMPALPACVAASCPSCAPEHTCARILSPGMLAHLHRSKCKRPALHAVHGLCRFIVPLQYCNTLLPSTDLLICGWGQ